MRELDLGDRVVDVAHRCDRVADEAIGGDGAVVVREPGVVRADHRAVHVAIGDPLEEPRGEHRREQHLGVDTVLVLLAETLLGGAGAVVGRPVGLEVGRGIEADRAAAGDVLAVLQQRLALDDPALAAIGKGDEPGRPLLSPVGYVPHPRVRGRLDVTVGRDHLVRACHGCQPFG